MKKFLSILTLAMMLCTLVPALCSAAPSGGARDEYWLRCGKCGKKINMSEQQKYRNERCLGKSAKSGHKDDGKHSFVLMH